MALFGEKLVQEIMALVRQQYLKLGAVLELSSEQGDVNQVHGQSSMLQRDLELLVGVANGQYRRSDEMVQRVEQSLTRVMDVLLGNALRSKAIIPDDFWKSDPGILISRARWWISVDDLITISNAAALAFGENTQANRMRIGRAIDNGILEWVPDPSVANPQQNKRVLRSQVERLRDQRRLPEPE